MVAQIDSVEPLKNARHEAFARAVASGLSASKAYETVYQCKPVTALGNAFRLIENDGVSARIAQLQQASATDFVMSMQERRRWLADTVRCRVNELDINSPLITRIKRRVDEEGKTVEEVWLSDKRACIELDAKLSGDLNDQGFGNVRDLQLFIVQNMQVINGLADEAPADELGD